MNLDNIYEGQVIKNYKELCKLLDIPEVAGRTKQRQRKWLQNYLKYYKEGYKIIIEEINREEEIIPMEDNRGKNPNSHKNQNGAYGKYIRLLVLNMLSQNEYKNEKNKILIGKNMMLQELNMINQNYRYGNYNREKMAHYLGMDIDFVHEFYNTNTSKLKQAVERTLNRLMNFERLIFWCNVKMIGKTNGEHREANEKEIKFITSCESEALKEMGVKDIRHIYAANRVKEFYEIVNSKLSKENIIYSYNAYKIIFADEVYKRNEQLKYKLEIKEERKNKDALNNTVYNKLTNSAIDRHNKTKHMKDKNHTKYKDIVSDKNFIDNNKKLINICIDNTYDNVCEIIAMEWEKHKDKIGLEYNNELDKIWELFE